MTISTFSDNSNFNYLDTIIPTLTMTGGTYTITDTATKTNIYNVSYDSSKGSVKCINNTIENIKVSDYNSLPLGETSVTCTATSNAGKTVKKTDTFNINGIYIHQVLVSSQQTVRQLQIQY